MEMRFNTVVHAVLKEDGEIIEERDVSNFLTEAGEALIANLLSDDDENPMSHIGIGSGSGQTRTDLTLAAQEAREDMDVGYPQQGTTVDDNDVILKSTFAAGVPASAVEISEGAVFNAASGGTMVNYFNFTPPISKSTAQSLELTVTITCGYS